MLLRLFLFLIYYFFLDWLRLNCMEVFHYVVEKLRVYPRFENGNKSIKINKERAQPAFTCSKLTIETLEQGVKYVQS